MGRFGNRDNHWRLSIRYPRVFFRISVLLCLLGIMLFQVDHLHAETGPTRNKGRKWRIGYYEGGPYRNYPATLRQIIKGLADLGWLEPVVIPEFDDPADATRIWDYLVKHVKSDYLEFVPDAYWSASWDKGKRSANKKQIIERLNEDKDIDFMFAAGTWAGLDLANTDHSTLTMAFSCSNPVEVGMVLSAERSGLDHFHVKCAPDRYIRQLRLFHRLVKFKKMGFVFENTLEGRSYAAYEDIQQVAVERGFSLTTCEIPASRIGLEEITECMIECHEKLARESDAVYVTVHRGINPKRMKKLVAPFLKHRIPTWSQRGPEEVKKGLLFSMTKANFHAVGKFHAQVMAQALNGETIGEIHQIFNEPEFIAVNLKVAEIIGFNIPRSILRISDEVYNTIEYE